MYKQVFQNSIENHEEFWAKAAEDIFWFKKYKKVLNSDNPPFYKWYEGGKTNTCYNALDLHIKNGLGEKIALIYDSPLTNSKKKGASFNVNLEIINILVSATIILIYSISS